MPPASQAKLRRGIFELRVSSAPQPRTTWGKYPNTTKIQPCILVVFWPGPLVGSSGPSVPGVPRGPVPGSQGPSVPGVPRGPVPGPQGPMGSHGSYIGLARKKSSIPKSQDLLEKIHNFKPLIILWHLINAITPTSILIFIAAFEFGLQKLIYINLMQVS